MSISPPAIEGDSRLKALVAKIRHRYRINYHEEKEKKVWTSRVRDRVVEIGYCDSPYPISCFAHELLHAELQMDGYRRLQGFFTGNGNEAGFKRFANALDNELQHHRMFPRFVSLGFPPSQFYDHREVGIAGYLEGVIRNAPPDFLTNLTDYLTLLAPGGELSDADRLRLDEQFKALAGGTWSLSFAEVQRAFANWSVSSSFSAEDTVRSVCQSIVKPCYMWFGYSTSDRPGKGGFFAGDPFNAQIV